MKLYFVKWKPYSHFAHTRTTVLNGTEIMVIPTMLGSFLWTKELKYIGHLKSYIVEMHSITADANQSNKKMLKLKLFFSLCKNYISVWRNRD